MQFYIEMYFVFYFKNFYDTFFFAHHLEKDGSDLPKHNVERASSRE
jgi:hypothetical protein